MKKILTIIAAMAAVLSSCQKSELESVSANDGKDIVLNISVSNPGVGTKAIIKQDWEENDRISIWYDTNVQRPAPDLVIKYNGTNWIQDKEAAVSGNTPSEGEGKYVKAIYNGTLKVASKDDYTFENNTLTFNIASWVFLTEIQVVVKGLPSESASSYSLGCDMFQPLSITNDGYTVAADGIKAYTYPKGAEVTGTSSADGVAFIFATANYSASSEEKKDFVFFLKDNTGSTELIKLFKPNVSITAKEGKSSIKALAIASSGFISIPDGFVDVGTRVDGKPVFWKTMNLGAENISDKGKLYSWGNVNGQSGDTFTTGFTSANYTGTPGALIDNSTVFWDTTTHDAAYAENHAWRMPTKEEFEAFCGATRVIDPLTSSDIKDGRVRNGFYSIGDSDNQSLASDGTGLNISTPGLLLSYNGKKYLFFPYTGYSTNNSRSNSDRICYFWTSTYRDGSRAYRSAGTNEYYYSPSVNNRYHGLAIRPVLNY